MQPNPGRPTLPAGYVVVRIVLIICLSHVGSWTLNPETENLNQIDRLHSPSSTPQRQKIYILEIGRLHKAVTHGRRCRPQVVRNSQAGFATLLPFLKSVHKMPQRHSRNNNDLGWFTYEEKRKLGFGTQKERLGKDSIKPFDACCLCLKPLIDPVCCRKGHLFCKECIYSSLLAQKKDIKRYVIAAVWLIYPIRCT